MGTGVRSGVAGWVRSIAPRRRDLGADAVAGLPGAISSVPDGMASGVLAGVGPIHGLYAALAGPIAGGLGSSTRMMVVTTTSAAALAAGSSISGLDAAERERAIVLLTLLAGAFMVLAGIARLGRYTRFVSHSVMIGFLTGIATNIVLGQLADLTGTSASGSTNVHKAIDVLIHPGDWDIASLVIGLVSIAILVGAGFTRFGTYGSLVALAVAMITAAVVGSDGVVRVEDTGDIPRGLPLPSLPHFSDLSPTLVAGAAAVAAIVLVQGAGVAQSAPNTSGPSNANQDFVAQGAGNVASGFFGGMPVGGSIGQTSLNVSVGARSRWAAIFAGIWMAVILVAFSGFIGEVPMPALAAILIVAAIGSLRPQELATILRTGPNSQIAVVATFLATLLLPVPAAVGIGVVISLLLQLNQEAIDLSVVQLVPQEDGSLREQDAPTTLTDDSIIVLDVYGSLFYAGALTLQARLPDPTGTSGAVVIVRLRGRTTLGATFFKVIADYAESLADANGRLYLSGLDPALDEHLREHGTHRLTGRARLYPAHPTVGTSTFAAYADANAWQVARADLDPDTVTDRDTDIDPER